MGRRVAAVLVLAVALAACGGSKTGLEPFGVGATASEDRERGGAGKKAPGKAGGERARTVGAGSEDPLAGLPSGPHERNTMPIDLRLSSECARPGQEMQAFIETRPGAKLGIGVVYSDNTPPDFTPGGIVQADADGRFTWTWVIRAATTDGQGIISVVAHKNGKGASYDKPFRISTAC